MNPLEEVREAARGLLRTTAPDEVYDATLTISQGFRQLELAQQVAWLDELLTKPGILTRVVDAFAALGVDDDVDTITDPFSEHVSDAEYAAIADSHFAAMQFLREHGYGTYPELLLHVPRGHSAPRAMQVRVPGGRAFDSMHWSTLIVSESHPAALAIFGMQRLKVVEKAIPSLVKAGPLDRFHPERFVTNHPGCKQISQLAARSAGAFAKARFSEADMQGIAGLIIKDASPLIRELPHEEVENLPQLGGAPMNQAISLALGYAVWVSAGRQIYDLPARLVESFARTEVDDVPLSMLTFRYPSIYLHWGSRADLEIEPGWLMDGAYVMSGVPGVLQITVTARPEHGAEACWWPIKGELFFFQAFGRELMAMDVGTAVDMALSNELAELKERAAREGIDYTAMLRELVDSGEVEPLAVPGQLIDRTPVTARQEIERLTRRMDAYKRALKLVIHALCYLTAYPEDTEPSYEHTAPPELVTGSSSSDSKTAERARSKLANLGYIPVHLAGRSFPEHQVGPVGRAGRHVRAHWRRGHWRRQPYGEGRAFRRLVWVMPSVVGSKGEDDVPGHIYLVS
jgi:hypothetical protein